ncbi:MAG: isoprenyl transferase [Myxococcales bacterium]|nr:MAG: isoprenyl transferase [Myxococcales bacterium]
MSKSHRGLLIPRSIAIIMDGNGRWAEKRGLAREVGHQQGSKVAEDIILYARELGIQFITLYAFSTENWQRPAKEVDAVMHILENYLKQDTADLIKNDIRISAIGNLDRLPSYVKKALDKVVEETKNCSKLIITLALSYGAWEEASIACQKIAQKIIEGKLEIADINQATLAQHLYTSDIPDPDLFIRTSGELRLSNFLLMQSSYTELYFTKTLWPDFQRSDLDQALIDFAQRNRRFGKVGE